MQRSADSFASTEDEFTTVIPEVHFIKEEVVYDSDDSNGYDKNRETLGMHFSWVLTSKSQFIINYTSHTLAEIDVQNIQDETLKNILMGQPSGIEGDEITEIEEVFVEEFEYRGDFCDQNVKKIVFV